MAVFFPGRCPLRSQHQRDLPAAAKYPELFLHIDAAWGGVFLALPECRKEAFLDEINARASVQAEDGAICAGGEVHSFCTNLHKYVNGHRTRNECARLTIAVAGAVSSRSTRVAFGVLPLLRYWPSALPLTDLPPNLGSVTARS